MAKILVIDDDPDITRLLYTQLADEEGHEVHVAYHGAEGYAKALNSAPDLILLDVFLPDSTGFQICSQLRKEASARTVPIIMMTGAAGFPPQFLEQMEKGANEYVSKPLNALEVNDLIYKYVPRLAKGRSEEGIPLIRMESPAAILESQLQADTAMPVNRVNLPLEISFMVTPKTRKKSTTPKNPTPAPQGFPISEARESFIPAILASKERFVDFGLAVFAVATRLCSTPAEKKLAGQLLRCSLSVSARLHESRFATSPNEFFDLLERAYSNLEETAHGLKIAEKTGLLDAVKKPDLVKTSQTLLQLLRQFIHSQK